MPPERNRCRFTNPPAYTLLFAAEHLAVEERPGRKNNRRGTQDHTVRQREPGHPIALEFQRRRFPLHNLQTGLRIEQAVNRGLEQFAVGLNTRPLHGRPLGRIEHPVMYGRCVGGTRNDTVKGIDLADKMALPKPTDRRIARHRADPVAPEADKRGARAHPRRCGGGFASGMATAHNNDIETEHDRRRYARSGGLPTRFT